MNRPYVLLSLSALAIVMFPTTAQAQTGSTFKNAGIADFARQRVAEANDAVIACDRAAFQRAVDAIDDTADDREGYARSNPNEQARSVMGSPEDAAADGRTLRAIQARLQREWEAAQPCTTPTEQADNLLNLGLLPQNISQADAMVDRLEAQALAAIRNCDKVAYERALGALADMDFDLGGLGGLIDRLDARWNAAACAKTASKDPFKFTIGPKVGVYQPMPMSYLGTRFGAGDDIFNFVKTNNELGLVNLSAELSYGLGDGYNIYNTYNIIDLFNLYNMARESIRIITRVDIAKADLSQSFNQIDPMGATLLIPGVGVGPNGAGFSLAGPNNQISNGMYEASSSFKRFYLGVEGDVQTAAPSVRITPSAGVEYGHYRGNYSFGGSIPVFARDFKYDTEMEVSSFSPTVGLDVNWRSDSLFEVFGGIKYSYNFNNADGKDTLHFTGFNPQTASMSENDSTQSHGANAGIRINPDGPVTVTLKVTYDNFGNAPELNIRDGVNRSDMELGDADVFTGGAFLTLSF